MEQLRMAVLGAGIMGRSHAAIIADYHRSQLVAVCSRNREAAVNLADRHGAQHVFTDYEQLMACPDVDAVVIATPDFAHHQAAVSGAQAGKHLLIEKPLATTANDADAIVAAVQRTGVTAMTLFNHRWIPAYAQAKAQLAEAGLGEPVMAYARKNDRIFVPTEMINWAHRTSPSAFLSSHDIDLINWYFESEAVEVTAVGVAKVLKARGIDTWDAVQAQVRYANGAIATFESTWIYPNTFPTMVDSFVEVVTTGGVIHLDRKEEQIQVASEGGYEFPRNLLSINLHGKLQGSLRHAITHFVDAVLDHTAPLIPLAHSRHVSAIVDAIHRSLAEGTPVMVR